jgi:signal transduction histidine kinase
MLPLTTTTTPPAETVPAAQTAAALEEAFTRFNQASERLQGKYEVLRGEVEELRAQLKIKDGEIKRAERLAALGKTAAAMAHEVRNPLGAIELFVSLLSDQVADRPESREYIAQIRHSINRLNTTVTNILHFSADRKLVRTPCNLHALINECVGSLPVRADSRGPVELRLEANPFLEGNECGLRQVVVNLVTNALQATRYSGHVVIETGNGAEDEVVLWVRDNGVGIPAEILPTIFEPFVTSKNEGTGLGLAIVDQIIGQHQGQIAARNLPAGGAEFEVRIPRKEVA